VEGSGVQPEIFEINRGPDPARWLIVRLMQIAWDHLKLEKPLEMTPEDDLAYSKARNCWICSSGAPTTRILRKSETTTGGPEPSEVRRIQAAI
jgi:hypothetical protein